jgi:hypothetical protein
LILIHPAAAAEARAARIRYAERDPAVARRFMDEYDRAIERVREHPDRWPQYPHLAARPNEHALKSARRRTDGGRHADHRRAVPVLRADDCALYVLGLRYCHVAAMRWSKLNSDGMIAIEEPK